MPAVETVAGGIGGDDALNADLLGSLRGDKTMVRRRDFVAEQIVSDYCLKRAQPPGKRALGESVTRTGFAPRITPSRASASFPPRNVSTRESSRSAAHASAPTQTRALARRRHSSTLRARETRHANWARFRVFSPRARDGTEGPRRSPCPRTSTSSSSRNGASRAKETAARRHATASRTYPRARARPARVHFGADTTSSVPPPRNQRKVFSTSLAFFSRRA